MFGGTTEMAFQDITGQVAIIMRTPVSAESTGIALCRI
jgi:hypothetical protein